MAWCAFNSQKRALKALTPLAPQLTHTHQLTKHLRLHVISEHKHCAVVAMALTGALAPTLHVSPAASLPLTHSTRRLLRRSHTAAVALQVSGQEAGGVCSGSGRARAVTLVRAMAESGTAGSRVEEKLGVRIERGPSEARLQELGIRSWPKWGCPTSKFPWTYDGKETCYLLKGKVKVYPEGSSDFVEFGAGDLVVFPKGMSCTWEVSEAVDKHYDFEY